MKLIIAHEAVDQHLSVAGELIDPDVGLATKAKSALKAAGFYGKWLPQLATGAGQDPGAFGEFGDVLAPHLRFVERSSRKLARSTFYGMSRWQGKLERKQGFLGRIVDIGAELYAMSASCVRAKMLIDTRAPEAESAVELAELFCRGAQRRVDQYFHDLWRNDDSENYESAQRVLAGRYSWAEAGVIDPWTLAPQIGASEDSSGNGWTRRFPSSELTQIEPGALIVRASRGRPVRLDLWRGRRSPTGTHPLDRYVDVFNGVHRDRGRPRA